MLAKHILSRHVTQVTGFAMLGAVLILSLLMILFSFFAELGDLSDSYNAWQAFKYVFFSAANNLNQMLPVSALIGAVIGLGAMASNSELVIMRASGVSLWRIVSWVMRPALLLLILSLVLTQWIIPYSNERAKSIKTNTNISSLGEVSGYWTREGQRYIYIDYVNSDGELKNIKFLDLDKKYHLKSWTQAASGQFDQKQQWQLTDVKEMDILPNSTSQLQASDQLPLSLALQPKYVHMVTTDPKDLAPSQLISYMAYLNEHSQVPKPYQLALWTKLAQPFSLISLVLIACSFIFGPLRQQSMGFRVVIALFVGLGFFYLQDFLGYASLVYSPSPGWFVLFPIVFCFFAGVFLLHRAR